MTIEDILYYEIFLHPKLEFIDLYKLIYQASFGPSHLKSFATDPYNDLLNEWNRISPSSREPLFQLISPHMFICRVNLRSFKYIVGNIDPLLQFFRKSVDSDEFPSQRFKEYFNTLISFVKKLNNKEILKGLDDFLNMFDIENPHPPEHSKLYIETYKPSYRVIIFSQKPLL